MNILGFIIVVLPLVASAATITVNTNADNAIAADGRCTLREAIANVNAAADTTSGDCMAGSGTGDSINFTLTPPATIGLNPTLGELAIGQNVTITGPAPNANSLRIDGRHRTRVFEISAGTTSMSDLSITGGFAPGTGGGVLVQAGASLGLSNCTLSANRAPRFADGGAIRNDGTIMLTNCTLSHNTTRKGRGAGILNTAAATLSNCALSDNRAIQAAGGGIANTPTGTLMLTNCRLSRNRAGFLGGGISNDKGTATLSNCTLSENRSGGGGGLFNQGTATLTDCTLSRNRGGSIGGGGGILNQGDGTLTATNCTLSRNTAVVGGLLEATGGGISTTSHATITNCTLNGNAAVHGGGINGAGVTMTNTIIANSPRGGNCAGSITTNGHNLSSDGTCFPSGGSELLNTSPALAPLANYSGLTDTMALCSAAGVPDVSCTGASPAIDAGDDAVTGPPDNITTDQRGLPRNAGAHVDIGAYEAQ